MGAPKHDVSCAKETSNEEKERRIKAAGLEYAKNKYGKYFVESSIEDKTIDFPKFDRDSLKLGKVLGKGGFGTVYEVRAVQIDNNVDNDKCQFIANHCLREETSDARYAIKVLSPEVIKDNGKFIQGTMDMAIEARILSDTEHPNIVKARALARVSPFSEDYFIMMDRLYDTMEGRIEKWKKKSKRYSGLGGKMFDRNGEKRRELWEERIVAAFDLSAALGYLHSKQIVYRDLKPENIGFDIRGDVKLFDFGLAVEMRDSRRADQDLYNLTGMTGSPRYMSPEVANEENYNEKCDVYSFAVLLWEMLSLKTPYEVYTVRVLKSRVWNNEHKRPFIDSSIIPEPIKIIMELSWNKDIFVRPSFSAITAVLRKQCVVARGGNDAGLEHDRRRSTFVFAKIKSGIMEELEALGASDDEDH